MGRPGASPRARALAAAADLIENTGGYAIAEEYCEEALAIARAANDDYLAAEVLQIRAWPLLRQGSPVPRYRSPSRAWAWPAASASPT